MKMNATTIVFLILFGFILILGGSLGWALHTVNVRDTQVLELELKIKDIIDAGIEPGPVWVAPWEIDPNNPTQTPTENSYAETIQQFEKDFEGIQDEKIFIDYASTDSIVRRDDLVAGYSTALRERLQSRIDSFTK